MYLPELFAVTDPDEVDFALAHVKLGCLVTRDSDGFFATHLPMLFDRQRRVLSGHVSKGNPHPSRSGDTEALVIFQGPNAYVSPSWYPSKAEHGKVVPTWNYEAAHVTGKLVWRREADWLRRHLAQLTDRFERDQVRPWALDDAPDDYLRRQIAGVVGLELEIGEVQLKRKFSQNRAPADQQGVVAGLLGSGDPADRQLAGAMKSTPAAR